MEEQHNEQPTPPKNQTKYKLFKIMTLTLFFITVFIALGYVGVETTSSSKFCSSCHEMKPEFYTWKASSHSEVDCVQCHISPGKENYAKAKANGLLQVFRKETQTYTAPIRMPNEIPDSACERCHNINTRTFTPSGDLIIPHDKHKAKGVACIQCHSGTAHGKIADRKITYQTDYEKWDDKTGSAMMSDFKFVKPDMDTCMECHKARKVTTKCTACHTTGMVPKSHKKEDFKTKTHGIQAATNLQKCNSCHKDMSTEPLEGYEDVDSLTKFLNNDNQQTKTRKTHYDYAKDNTFCKDCHSKRPPSHTANLLSGHGELASKNKRKCLACHNYQEAGGVKTSMVACGSCHPAMHQNSFYKDRHPVPLAEKQKVTDYCYTCHSKPRCSGCHKE